MVLKELLGAEVYKEEQAKLRATLANALMGLNLDFSPSVMTYARIKEILNAGKGKSYFTAGDQITVEKENSILVTPSSNDLSIAFTEATFLAKEHEAGNKDYVFSYPGMKCGGCHLNGRGEHDRCGEIFAEGTERHEGGSWCWAGPDAGAGPPGWIVSVERDTIPPDAPNVKRKNDVLWKLTFPGRTGWKIREKHHMRRKKTMFTLKNSRNRLEIIAMKHYIRAKNLENAV